MQDSKSDSQKQQDDKELLYKALGVMMLIKDKFSDEFNEIFQKANASKEDILKSVDEVKEKAQSEKTQMEEKLNEKIKEIVKEMGLATKEDIEELKRLIKESGKS